jgi:hypothetical protein
MPGPARTSDTTGTRTGRPQSIQRVPSSAARSCWSTLNEPVGRSELSNVQNVPTPVITVSAASHGAVENQSGHVNEVADPVKTPRVWFQAKPRSRSGSLSYRQCHTSPARHEYRSCSGGSDGSSRCHVVGPAPAVGAAATRTTAAATRKDPKNRRAGDDKVCIATPSSLPARSGRGTLEDGHLAGVSRCDGRSSAGSCSERPRPLS